MLATTTKPQTVPNTSARRELEGDDLQKALGTAGGLFGRYLGSRIAELESRIAALEAEHGAQRR